MKKIDVYIQIKNLKDDQLKLGEDVYRSQFSGNKGFQKIGTFGGWGRESVKLLKNSIYPSTLKICHSHYWIKREVTPDAI